MKLDASLTIGIPSGGDWCADTALSVIGVITRTISSGANIPIAVNNVRGADLPKQMTEIVYAAIAAGSSHILFVDSDMEFPPDTFLRLFAHDVDVVGANYVKKNDTLAWNAMWEIGRAGRENLVDSSIRTGVETVGAIPSGLMLVRTSVFARVKEPWFGQAWVKAKDSDKLVSIQVDVYFCAQCALAGIDVYVDHDLSKLVGHIGYRSHRATPPVALASRRTYGWKSTAAAEADPSAA